MADDLLRYAMEEKVAVLRMDDGKANAFSPAMLDALHAALDRALADGASAIALIGREGRLSGGFDLSVMREGPTAAMNMVARGASLASRVFDCPVPFLVGATGHAVAMGAVLLMAADERIGAEGDFKIGLNEVKIKMTLPEFAIVLARERLSKRHLQRSVNQAEIYDGQGAVDAGFLDRVVPLADVESTVLARARELAETLDPKAHRETKAALRAVAAQQLRDAVEAIRPR